MSNVSPEDVRINASWEGFYIDGSWEAPEDRDHIAVQNPTARETIAEIPAAAVEDVDRAFNAATRAQPKWANETPERRASVVRQTAELIDEYESEIRKILAVEGGGERNRDRTSNMAEQ